MLLNFIHLKMQKFTIDFINENEPEADLNNDKLQLLSCTV